MSFRLVRAFLVSLPFLFASLPGWAADGRILDFHGDVRVNGQPVTLDTPLNSGDRIATGADGVVTIVLADNSVLDLEENSQISLAEYAYDAGNPGNNASNIGVVEGSLRYVSGLIAKEDSEDVSFNAGNSTIGIRGSYTRIDVAGSAVNVEAMVGQAVVIVESENCPPRPIVVPTGQVAVTNPVTCEIELVQSSDTDEVNAVVQLIASLDSNNPEDAEKIAGAISELSEDDQVIVVAVLINNQEHLEIDSDVVAETILIIAEESPDSLTAVVAIAAVLDGDNQDKYEAAANEGAPGESDSVQEGEDKGEEIREDLDGDDDGSGRDSDDADEPGGDGGDQGPGDGGGDDGSPGSEVPPGGGDIPDPPSPE